MRNPPENRQIKVMSHKTASQIASSLNDLTKLTPHVTGNDEGAPESSPSHGRGNEVRSQTMPVSKGLNLTLQHSNQESQGAQHDGVLIKQNGDVLDQKC